MHAAGWYPADPVTLRSSIEIAGSVLLDRPYRDAPVSPLFYLGPPRGSRVRKAGRQQRRSPPSCAVLEGAGPRRGTAAGLARRGDLRPQRRRQPLYRRHHPPYRRRYRRRAKAARRRPRGRRLVDAKYQVTGIGPTMTGRNGGGDPYYTDGEVWILRLVVACQKRTGPATVIPARPPPRSRTRSGTASRKRWGNRALPSSRGAKATKQSSVRHSGMVRQHQTSDAQLRIGGIFEIPGSIASHRPE